MKKIILFAAVVMLFATCKKDMSTGISDQAGSDLKKYADIASNALLSAKAPVTVTGAEQKNDKLKTKALKSSGSGIVSYIPGGCGAGTMQLHSVGSGNSTHMGSFTQSTNVCINPLTGALIGPVLGVATAANGDELHYMFVGTGTDAATGFTYQNYILTGGTGKFTSATGDMTLLYQVRTPTNLDSYTGTGTITTN